MNFPVRNIIISLKKNGVSFREVARHLGVSHTTVRFWVKGVYKPRDPDKILRKLSTLLVEDRRPLVDDYYSSTHNGEPNHLFGLKPGEDHYIQRFKRAVKKVADILDTYNRIWIETATIIGLDYFRRSVDNIGLYSSKLFSFVVACYRVAMYKIHYVYPEWDAKLKFMQEIKLINIREYTAFLSELAKIQLI